MPETHLTLVAVPGDWGNILCQELEMRKYSIVHATSYGEAVKIILANAQLLGVVIVSEWAMPDERPDGIMKLIQGKIPSVTIITEQTRHSSGYLYMDKVFFPPFHEYVHVPFDIEELEMRMKKTGIVKE